MPSSIAGALTGSRRRRTANSFPRVSAPGSRLPHLERAVLDHELLLVRREAHDGAGPGVEHARQGVSGRREVRDGEDVIVDRRHFVLGPLSLHRSVAAILASAVSEPVTDPSVVPESMLEGLSRGGPIL